MTLHTLRDPDNRDDEGAPFEFTGDAERVAAYLDVLAERDMRTDEGRAAVTALAAAIRTEGTVSPGHAESIRQAAGVYVTAAVTAAHTPTTEQVRAAYIEARDRLAYSPSAEQQRRYEESGGAAGEFDRWLAQGVAS